MVSAWSTANGVVLGQEKTAEKSHEITAMPELLKSLEIKGCIVSIDAMGCQKAIAEQIIQQKGDYLLALKGNHKQLHEEVKDFFQDSVESNFSGVEHDFHQEVESGHGRVETRRAYVVNFKRYKKQWASGQDRRFYLTSSSRDTNTLFTSGAIALGYRRFSALDS